MRDGKYRRRQRATRGLTGSPQANAPGGALVPVLDVRRRVTLATWHQLITSFGFATEDNGIKVFNRNPARVIPALGTNP